MEKILVAMSGGVDSSVTAAMMVDAGYDVTGITMRLGAPDTIEVEPSVPTAVRLKALRMHAVLPRNSASLSTA